jgi:hypothetical protein
MSIIEFPFINRIAFDLNSVDDIYFYEFTVCIVRNLGYYNCEYGFFTKHSFIKNKRILDVSYKVF